MSCCTILSGFLGFCVLCTRRNLSVAPRQELCRPVLCIDTQDNVSHARPSLLAGPVRGGRRWRRKWEKHHHFSYQYWDTSNSERQSALPILLHHSWEELVFIGVDSCKYIEERECSEVSDHLCAALSRQPLSLPLVHCWTVWHVQCSVHKIFTSWWGRMPCPGKAVHLSKPESVF